VQQTFLQSEGHDFFSEGHDFLQSVAQALFELQALAQPESHEELEQEASSRPLQRAPRSLNLDNVDITSPII